MRFRSFFEGYQESNRTKAGLHLSRLRASLRSSKAKSYLEGPPLCHTRKARGMRTWPSVQTRRTTDTPKRTFRSLFDQTQAASPRRRAEGFATTVSSTIRYPPATVNKRRKARSRSLCPDQVPWSIRVKRSWETPSNASAMAEQVVMLVKYSKAMRYIQSGSGIESHLPSESLCLFLCGLPVTRILCLGLLHALKGVG